MSTSEENLQIKTYFKHVSVETFIKYFFVFKKNKNIRSNSLIYNAFSENNEDWTKKSFVSRASKSKKIFKEKLEILALEYIVNEGNKVEEQYRTHAAKILNLYQLAKQNIIEQTEDENSDSAGKLVSKNLFNSEDLLFTSEEKFVKFFINLLANNITYMSDKSEDLLIDFAFQFFENYDKDWYFSYYDSKQYYRIIPSEVSDDSAVQEFIQTLVELNQDEIYDLYNRIDEEEY